MVTRVAHRQSRVQDNWPQASPANGSTQLKNPPNSLEAELTAFGMPLAKFLKPVLAECRHQEFIRYLILPASPILAQQLGCATQDIENALIELTRWGFAFEHAPHTGAITLWHPGDRASLTSSETSQ